MKDLSLYIHIPFCKTICTFCNFLTFAHKNKWIPDYINSLCQEIEIKAEQNPHYIIESIYFGGGTPSLIEPKYIEQVLTIIKKNFALAPDIEISLECNPESLDRERLEIYQKNRVTRLSLGVQSLNNKTLLKVARPHNADTTLKSLQLLKDFGWENFGCDLIMGLPYQTLSEFKTHLEKLLEFNPKHLSAYFLSYDTNRIDTFIKDSPAEEEQIKMYWHLQKRLSEKNFSHYEVSNYAQPNFECRHNLRYWNQQEYLGLGLGAHSYINSKVIENTRNFDLYLTNPMEIEDSYLLDQETLRMDYIMLNLRKNQGLNLQEYSKKFGQKALLNLKKLLIQNKIEGLEISENQVNLNNHGYLFADQIYKNLI
jgi:oxygen-independent coproporphyrinogen III oxidase